MRRLVDLAPLILTAALILAEAIILIDSHRNRTVFHLGRMKNSSRFILVLILATLPYLSITLLDGDPDVWDYYHSIWILPALSVVIFSIFYWHLNRRNTR